MGQQFIDINCDLGEGMADDALLMPFLDSCNIACGGHAGTQQSMLTTLKLARDFNVNPGAHPSFEDKLNFGRKVIQVPIDELKSQVITQIQRLNEIAKKEDIVLTHVKAHGALYNVSAESYELAMALIEALTFFKEDLCIFVPYGSLIERIAKKEGILHKVEVFADRNYNDALKLLPRSHPESVINDPDFIGKRVSKMITENMVRTFSGKDMKLDFDTICVHGDHPRALEVLRQLYKIKTD